jgi:glycosyltransferase involved in cell wall biosynthesis
MNTKISVLMPVYNGGKYLKEAIDSVLSQDFKDFELIIINDCSKDNSRDIIKSYNDNRIVLIDNEMNKGLISSLNIGLKYCKGKYTARLDQDDIALPNRFKKQYEFMESNPNIDLVGSWTNCITQKGEDLKISRNSNNPVIIKYELLFNNVMFHSSIFFKTELIKKNGGYSMDFIHSEDYEMYSRPGMELNCSNIQEVLFKLRIHNESITGDDNSQKIVHLNALNVAYRNMSQYHKFTREVFDRIKIVLIIKKPDPKITLSTVLIAENILKKITKNFIIKNKLSNKDYMEVIKSYRGRRKMMWQHYLIGKYKYLLGKK